MTMKN
jgi:hypothetical protein